MGDAVKSPSRIDCVNVAVKHLPVAVTNFRDLGFHLHHLGFELVRLFNLNAHLMKGFMLSVGGEKVLFWFESFFLCQISSFLGQNLTCLDLKGGDPSCAKQWSLQLEKNSPCRSIHIAVLTNIHIMLQVVAAS
ncbi:hypothetical protein AAHA92_27006 [Salvia divinorum]|uniref:Uncharacterized protein n=1 Tax=Salvia divinorum TaxID=28513 RepID=A0ABD1G2E3_SALDI